MAEVFDRTAPELLLVARRLARDAASAEDLVQQTFLRAIERAAQFEAGCPLMPWLTTILANEARMETRRRRHVPAPPSRGDSIEPSREAERREAEQAMERALGELPPTYRDVVALRLLHGVKPKQIAAALAVPVGTVKTRLHRGMRKLAASLPSGLALGAAVSLCAGSGVAAGRRAITSHAAATSAAGSAAGWAMTGLFTMKKTVLVAAIAAALLIVVSSLWRDSSPPHTAVTPGLPAFAMAATAERAVEVDPSERTPILGDSRAAPPAEPDPLASFESSITVRATWSRSKAPAVDVPLTLIVQPNRRIAYCRTDGAGEGRFDAEFSPDCWYPGVRPEDRQASIVCAFAPGSYHSVEATPGTRVVEIEIDEATRAHGIVVDTAGAPVGEAIVWLGIRHAPAFAAARTAGDGRFALRGVPEGFWLRASAGLMSSATVTRADLDDEQGEFVLRLDQPAGHLSVRVEDRSGQPMRGATLRFDRGWQHPESRHMLISDEQGLARWPGCPAGSYVLEVVHGTAPPAQRRIEVPPSGGELFETVVLGSSAELVGVVRRPNGTAVPGASITCNDAASLLQVQANTDKEGRFGLNGLAVGTYDVWVRSDPSEFRKRIELREGRQEIELVLPGAARVAGRLLLPSGEPAVGWTVRLHRLDEMAQRIESRVDATGRFGFDDLPDRAYRLEALGPNVDGSLDVDAAHPFFDVATDGEERVYRLPPNAIWQAAAVVGQILDAPEGASLWVAAHDRSRSNGRSLRDDGSFERDGLRPGTYHVGLYTGDVMWWFAEVEVESGQRLDVGVYRFPTPGRLRVAVTDDFDSGDLTVSATAVGFESKIGSSRLRALSSSTWEAAALAPGDYIICAHGERVSATPVAVTIEAGATAVVSLTTQPVEKVVLRLAPPPGVGGSGIGVRREIVRDDTGAVVRETEIMGSLEHELWLAAGWHVIDVQTSGGFRGRAEFTVPLAEGSVVVVPLAR